MGLERDRDRDMGRDWDRIGLSAVAPPAGSDFPLRPLPVIGLSDVAPPGGIGLSDVAPPAGSNPTVVLPTGSTATPRDHSNIL